jgi:acetyl-CoA carboxylase/biotin carboxylase 1
MEMFADEESRGGILEPPGICEVKYRSQEQVVAMHRLDHHLNELDEMLSHELNNDEKIRVASDIKLREKVLAPLYTQVAHEFADLHDRAGRMKAKGCINEILQWKNARSFFYWRILKRQKFDSLNEHLVKVSNDQLTEEEAAVLVRTHSTL